MALHNTMDYRQPHSSSFTYFFGRKKRIKYIIDHVLAYPASRITHS